MNIITFGSTPFLNTSKSEIHKRIISHLSIQHNVKSFVWGHNKDYHVPDNEGKFYYNKIELLPYRILGQEKYIEERLKENNPDLVILVGDLREFSFINKISFNCKCIFVFLTYITKITEDMLEVLSIADGVLCVNKFTKKVLEDSGYLKILDFSYVGNTSDTRNIPNKKYRVMMNCKRMSQDNLPMGMEICSKSRFDLYVHTNVHEGSGDYDAVSLANLFDPKDKYINLPEDYVSTVDGIHKNDLFNKYKESDIYLHIPVSMSTGLTFWEAISNGCFPLMNTTPISIEFASLLDNFDDDLNSKDFLINSIPIMIPGESYIYIPNPADVTKKIKNAIKKISNNKGLSTKLIEFSKRYDGNFLLIKLDEMIELVIDTGSTLILETI